MSNFFRKLKGYWHDFLAKSAWFHFGCYLIWLIGSTLIITLLASASAYPLFELSFNETLKIVRRVGLELTVTETGVEISHLWKLIFWPYLVFITAVWEALLVFKLLDRPDDIVISDTVALYPKDFEIPDEDQDYVVFTIFNQGMEPLFDIEINVLLRNYNPAEGKEMLTYYPLEVKNPRHPILKPYMPFRIFIKTGSKQKIGPDIIFDPRGLDESDHHGDQYRNVTIENEERRFERGEPLSELIVYISGLDKELGEQKIATKRYHVRDIKVGRFENISVHTTEDGKPYFDRNTVLEKYETIVEI